MDHPTSSPDALNEREQAILNYLAEGLSNREIAARLHLSIKTVKWHNTEIYSKLGVRNRKQAVEQAQERGLLYGAGTRHSLPHQTTAFIGRRQELRELGRLLIEPETRLVTILAPGGMGKTRLALAAGWVDMLSLEQIADEIQRGIDILATEMRDVPDRHRSIRATFEHTWNRLDAAEQTAFGKLSIFRGGFTAEAALDVAGADLYLLRSFVDKALIQALPTGRNDIHELLRQFASDKINQMGMTEITAERHLDYFISLAAADEKHHFGHEQIRWFDQLEADIENIRTALAWSLEANETTKGLELAGLMAAFWSVRSYVAEGYEWLRLLTMNQDAPAKLRAGALYQAARLAGAMGDGQAALKYGEEAIALARNVEDPSLTAWSLLNLGAIIGLKPDLPRATALLDESLALFTMLDDPHGVNNILRMQSANAIRQGKIAYARQLFDEVLRQSSDGGHTIGLAQGHELLGRIAWTQEKNVELARTHLAESLARYGEAGSSLFAARVHVSLALVEHAAGNPAEAQRLFQAAYLLLK